jgi:NAD(P)-dependent dehydrogenase (short-subunit alcohol dehydrogenase family)
MKKQKILVTGSASGLGLAIATRLREAGHEVVDFDKAFGSFDNRRFGDVREAKSVDMRELVGDSLDVLINCAGINHNEWFEDVEVDIESWSNSKQVMNVNAWGIVGMTQTLLPQLIKAKGTVINIVSNAAHIPMTGSLAYNASKAAALAITKQMAHELTPKYGLTIFSISPNKLEGTGMSKQIEENVIKNRGWTPEYAKEYQKKALMHGLETPPDAIARLITHLVNTGDSLYLSGCDIQFGK